MSIEDTLYARWLSGELNEEELKALKESGELEELESIKRATENLSLPAFDLDAGFEKLKQAPKARVVPMESKTKISNLRFMVGIAASLVFLIVAFFLLQNDSTSISAAYASNETYEWENEALIKLNDGSSIKCKKKNNARLVDLVGEAYFSVTKGGPFTIKTKNGTVKVLGTVFNVRSWGDNLYVECFEGRVEVSSVGTEKREIGFGERINLVKGKMGTKQAIVHKEPFWFGEISKFQEEPLNVVFQELERQYNIKVEVPVVKRNFTGTFNHDNLEQAVEQICKPMGLKFEISEDQKVVNILK